MKKLLFNKAVAETVMEELHAAYVGRTGLFAHVQAETHAPQHLYLPNGVGKGTLAHRRWLFFAVMTDRRQVSTSVYQSHITLHRQAPHMYDERMLGLTEHDIHREVAHARIGLPNQSAGFWHRCGRTLFKYFEGDPTYLYHMGSINKLMEWKAAMLRCFKEDPLPGYGPKISSLLAVFLEELGCPPVDDALPVDVHVQRFFLAHNLIVPRVPVSNVDLEEVIRPFITKLCAARGWDRVDLCHALWLLGNRVCSNCHRRADAELLCPVYSRCKGPPETRSYFLDGQWNPRFRRLRKGGQQEFKIHGPLFAK